MNEFKSPFSSRCIFIILIFALCVLAHGGWLHTFGTDEDDYLSTGIETADGEFLMVGYSQSADGDYDVWCLWLDENGNEIHSTTYGGEYDDKAYGVAKIDDGFIMVGETKSFGRGIPGYSNCFIIRIDTLGESIWQYPAVDDTTSCGEYDDCFYRVACVPDDTICVAVGQYWVDFSSSRQEPAIFKFNPYSADAPDGDIAAVAGGSYNDEFKDILIADETLFACGMTKSTGTGTPIYSNGYLVSLNNELDVQSSATFGGENNDEFLAIQYDDEILYLVGKTTSFGVDMDDIYVLLYSIDSGVISEFTVGGIYTDVGVDICPVPTEEEDFILLSKSNSVGAGYDDFYLLRANIDGDIIWEQTYGGMNNDWASSLVQLGDGLLLIGSSSSAELGTTGWDGMVVKVNFDGDTTSSIAEITPPNRPVMSIYPNPFNRICKIEIPFFSDSDCAVKILDLSGNIIDNLNSRDGIAIWQPSENIRSGVYLVKAKTDRQILIRKVFLMK
ncbi:hypothetical protein DRQ33_00250 [bacterium]|nr:MAG: hypothetical protein DRQ33_00250 [bacterium]